MGHQEAAGKLGFMVLFPGEVARVEEPRMVADLTRSAEHAEPILGGVMARSAPGGWTNHAIGMCMGCEADAASLNRLIPFYEDHGIEARVELCPMAHESLVKGLAERGFVLKGFESVIARALEPGGRIESPVPRPAGLTMEPVDLTDDGALREYARAIFRIFMPPDHPGPTQSDMDAMARFLHKPGTVALEARIDGEFAGGGSVSISSGSAALAGAAVREPFRRRGVQQHLVAKRLRLACEAGATMATVGSKPGVATERNVLRMGFALAYTRAILVRPGEGLVGEPG